MDIIELGAQLLSDTMGLDLPREQVADALNKLLSDGNGNLDLAGLAGRFAASGGLADVVGSWLGDGPNAGISANDILDLFGNAEVDNFAANVGADRGTAASGLAQVLPEIMDKASSGGSILESLGGAGGLLGAAKGLLG